MMNPARTRKFWQSRFLIFLSALPLTLVVVLLINLDVAHDLLDKGFRSC
jgi:hypothetical protein